MNIDAFVPFGSQNVALASGINSTVKLTPGSTVRVANVSNGVVRVRLGLADVVASVTDCAVPEDAVAFFSVRPLIGQQMGSTSLGGPTHIALFAAGDPGDCNVATGDGGL